MRLLHLDSLGAITLTKDFIDDVPSYAILSHTWGADEEEVTFDDMTNGSGKTKAGYVKIEFCAEQVQKDGLEHFWIDTCCINKTNLVELSEAITSMFAWYRDAVKCYVYLADVLYETRNDDSDQLIWKLAFQESRYWYRGWTLQELIAPKVVEFYSREGHCLGNKKTLESLIYEVTAIPITALRGEPMSNFTVQERLQWAAKRSTKRREDKAYCLLGIFEVFMPLMYGEGDNAFDRLQRKITKRSKSKANSCSTIPGGSEAWTTLTSSQSLQLRTEVNLPPLAIRALVAALKVGHDSICSGNPNFNRQFFSRSDELDLIGQKFVPVSDKQERLVLCGLPGMGKTTIALQYLQLQRDRYKVAIWIDATSPENAQQSFRKAAAEIKRHGYSLKSAADMPPDDSHSILTVIHWLEISCQNWLLVLDGLDDLDAVDARRYLPQCKYGHILITSILFSTAGALHATSIPIEPLTPDGATELLLSWLTVGRSSLTEKGNAYSVVKKLGCVPLAVEQAGALIAKTGISFDDFLDQYAENYKYIVAEKPARSEWSYDRNLSICATFETLLNHRQIREEPTHRRFMTLLSFLGPGEIPLHVICQKDAIPKPNSSIESMPSSSTATSASTYVDLCLWYHQIAKPKNLLLKLSIHHLEDFSLLHVKRSSTGEVKSVSIHGAMSTWLTSSLNEGDKIAWTIFAASLSCADLPDIPGEESAPNMRTSGSQKNHIFSILRQNIEQTSVTTFDKILLDPYGIVMRKLAYHFSRSQNPTYAEEAVTRSIEYEMFLQGSGWPRTQESLVLLDILGDIYWKSQRLEDAEGLFDDLFESCTTMLGLEADLTLAISIKLKHVRERIINADGSMERAVQATTYTKRDGDSLFGDSKNDILYGHGPVSTQSSLSLGRSRATYESFYAQLQPVPSYEGNVKAPNYSLSSYGAEDTAAGYGPEAGNGADASIGDLFLVLETGKTLEGDRLFQHAIPMYLRLWPYPLATCSLQDSHGFEEAAAMLTNKEPRFEALLGLLRCYKDYGVLTTAEYFPLAFPMYAAFHHNYQPVLDYLDTLVKEDTTHEFRSRVFTASVVVECMMMILCFRRANYDSHTDFRSDIRLWISKNTSRHGNYLSFAAGQGDARLVKGLLEAGVQVDTGDSYGRTALYEASRNGRVEVVQILLEAGAREANIKQYADSLHTAAGRGHVEVVQQLLAQRGDLVISHSSYRQALLFASSKGHTMVTEVLLGQDEIAENRAIFHTSDLTGAARHGHEQTVKMILDCGVDTKIDARTLDCALFHASLGGHERVVELLIQRGADVNSRGDDYSGSLLMVAALRGHEMVVKLLLDAGADPDAPIGFLSSVLRAAAEQGHEKIVKRLLVLRSDVNACCGDDKNYGCALWAAARRGKTGAVKLLLESGADVNAPYGCYGTALEVATRGKHDEVVALLLSHGATPIPDTSVELQEKILVVSP